MPWWSWSQTASSNASSDSNINWAEGQAPSSINDSARGMMAETAKYRDDIAGAIVTAGTATAYTVTSYSVFDTLAHMNGAMIAFTPHATNTNAVGVDVTLNVDGLGAKSIRAQPNVALPNGSLVLGTPYVALYNNSDAVWYLKGGFTNPYNVPLAGCMDFFGTSVPNSSFAFPIGQAISRTTYATLFAITSTTYGVGDGSTTFNLPDLTGRVTAMKEASATRLTGTYFPNGSTNMGATGGADHTSNTIAQANLPSVNLTVTSANVTVFSRTESFYANTGTSLGLDNLQGTGGGGTSSFTYTVSGQTAALGGSGTALAVNSLPPTIVCNKILRVI